MVGKVGLDLGYGQVKMFTTDGQAVDFVSAVGSGRRLNLVSKDNNIYENLRVEYDGQEYFVGGLAMRESDDWCMTMERNKISHQNTFPLFLAAIGLLQDGLGVYDICTGLPVSDFGRQKDSLKEQLEGLHEFSLCGQSKKIEVRACSVVPQGAGVFFSELFGANGSMNKALTNGRRAVIDIGENTVDVVVVEDMRFIDRLSKSFNDGMSTAYRNINREIDNLLDYRISPHQLKQAICTRTIYTFDDEEIAIGHQVDSAYEKLANKLYENIFGFWKEDIGSIRRIYLAGGGAVPLFPFLKDRIPVLSLVRNAKYTYIKRLQDQGCYAAFANAIGFANLAHMGA